VNPRTRHLTKNLTGPIVRPFEPRGVDSSMNKQPDGSYEGVKPAPGRDDSDLDPFEIEFKQEFRGNRGPEEPFLNTFGVVIGDHDYASGESPLERWTEDTDPAVMAGEQWVHPYKDSGFRTRDNRDLFERGIPPQAGIFMHPTLQVSAADEPEFKAVLSADYLAFDDRVDPDDDYFPVPEVLDEP
jgi:hypothetical protein